MMVWKHTKERTAMSAKRKPHPLDSFIDDLVVFKHEDGTFVSNSPYWNDKAIRERWIAVYGQDAPVDDNEDGIPDVDQDDDEDEEVDYSLQTNDWLRGELSARKLDVNGNKDAMIKRLQENDEEE